MANSNTTEETTVVLVAEQPSIKDQALSAVVGIGVTLGATLLFYGISAAGTKIIEAARERKLNKAYAEAEKTLTIDDTEEDSE